MKTRKIIIDGIIHKDNLKKGKFGWYDFPICVRKDFGKITKEGITKCGILPKYFRKVHMVITVSEVK